MKTQLDLTWTRRSALRYLGTTIFSGPLAAAGVFGRATRLDAVDLVRESGAVDMLGLLTADWKKLDRWCTHAGSFTQKDFQRVRRSGLGLFHPAVRVRSSDPKRSAERWLRKWRRFASFHPTRFEIVRSARQLRPGAAPPVGILLGMQDSEHFERPHDVEHFAAIGQRVSQLTYNGVNRFGSGCQAPQDKGLTREGFELVEQLNRHGVAVDVSHCGEATTLDAIQASTRPVLVTHSNCRALNPRQPRCKTDGAIQALARHGGVFGVSMIRNFVAPHHDEATFERYLDHFDHVANLVGPEFIGVGSDSDLDGRQPVLHDVDAVEFLYHLAAGLLSRGYNEAQVMGVLGGNFRRALRSTLPPVS